MTNEEKLEAIAEIFDADSVPPETDLSDLGWDSMAMLSFIAVAKNRANKRISGAEIREFSTVQDLMDAL